MEKYGKELGQHLNDILQRNYDSEKCFGKAAENATSRSLATWFNERALERRRFADELILELITYGQEPEDNGTLSGDFHRTWMDVKAFFVKDNDEAMLEEADKGENATAEAYEKALSEIELPATTAALLLFHKARIEHGQKVLHALEDIEFERQ